MEIEQLTVRVELPKSGDADFEALVEHLAEAVYQRVKERLEQDTKGAKGYISDA
jgi:hypothetical protein